MQKFVASEKHYNLKDLWKHEKKRGHLFEDENKAACSAYLKEILGTSYEYKVNNGIAGLGSLPPLYCSTIQRPDVQVLQCNQTLLVIEVHSSKSYEATIEKCIIGMSSVSLETFLTQQQQKCQKLINTASNIEKTPVTQRKIRANQAIP